MTIASPTGRQAQILYPRNALPGNHARHVASLRTAKEKRERLPKWLGDEKVCKRVLVVYADYLNRMSLPDLSAKHQISITQIYKDIGRARVMRALLFQGELEHMLMEQIQARQQIIAQARASMVRLRETGSIPLESVLESGPIQDEARVVEWTPAHARAEADLLRVVSENEKAIEELTGLRDRLRQQPEELSSGAMILTRRITAEETVYVNPQDLDLVLDDEDLP